MQAPPGLLTHQELRFANLGHSKIHQSRITRVGGHRSRRPILHLSFLPFVMSKYRIRVRPGMAFSLPVTLMMTLGWLVVYRKIVKCYEERICAESQPGGRFAFLCAIPLGKGGER